jgi:hypothetical protein
VADETISRPAGEYAIVECLGHRTLIGRMSEVERFGTKMLAVEPIWKDELLPAVLIGGASIYQLTPCTPATAFSRQPQEEWQMPASVRSTLPPSALPAPEQGATEDPEPEFAPRFLDPDEDERFL